ncbi:scavenger receptor cysteine-rich domain-containing protein DMBT1-like [Odontesthes bonariensis]|uniref:scavenger receptor cysteine-rich domain-containing protein DMBT1-like n=1 Tax=Odontesthes bonariensis TaxID=219752 RepID=UPI003F580ADF
MISISVGKPHLGFVVMMGLLNLPLFTECVKVRLVGPSRCAGRVEVFHENSWGTVCDDYWSLASASVVCRELNCGTVLEAKKSAFFGEGKEEIVLDDVKCVGHESSILKCPHKPLGVNNCGHSEDAGVICSEHVQIVNGTNRCNGRVQIFNEGQWKRACNSDWGIDEASVLCREISCGTPTFQPVMPNFGQAHGLTGVKTSCVGNESSVSECMLDAFKESCSDAVIICTNSKPIRLINGTNRCSGRVEFYHEGQWGTVCDDKWGLQEAAVACREMNCGNALAVKYKAFFGRGHDQVWLDDVECTGHEKSLAECPHRGFGEHDCDHSEDAGIICSESVRLSNGTDSCSGKVEVVHSGEWVKVCNNNWGLDEAKILCKELNCGPPKKSQEDFTYGDSTLTGYISRCSGNVSSVSQCMLEQHIGTCEGVSVTCTGNPPLRLVNGTDRCSGRVEVLHDGQWGTVCDDEWDMRDAQVVCRAMDCGTAWGVKTAAYFGQGQGDILMDDVNCIGNETSLLHCKRSTMGENNCGHSEDAGVICSANIRLINGTNQCSGRVEVYHGVHWLPVYKVDFGMNEVAVVCREMNCGDPVKVTGSFGNSGELRGLKVRCSSGGSSLTQCTLTDYVRTRNDRIQDASIECSGNVKLVDGSHRCVGRVEIYNKNKWWSVCGESWDMHEAAVVCKQMGCGRAHSISTWSEYGLGSGQTWTERIECSGNEYTLSQCTERSFRDRTCNATSVAGVVCQGSLEVQLANGADECSGRVEVRHGETWQTVCDTDWTQSKAQVACDVLGCGTVLSAPGGAHFGQGNGSVVEASGSCFDNVTSLQKCSAKGFRTVNCGHERDAGVICAAQLRLVSGSGQCSGRVEIFHKSQWGTVCDDDWEIKNADVVCRQLGCGHAVAAPTNAHFGRGSGPIWLDNVDCSGTESALAHCTHAGFGENNCGHGEDASAICLGALQKPQITISPAPEVNWGEKVEITCSVVSEHLGGMFVLKNTQGTYSKEKFSEHEAATFVFPSVDFGQKGSYFCEYYKKLPDQVIYYPQGNTADLSVLVKLEKPSIFLDSPHAMVIYRLDKITVNKDSTFSITCSTYATYSTGVFYLTKSETNHTEVKEATGHTIYRLANFEFSGIDFQHQGEYFCVYAVNISTHLFCSLPSKPLQISVISSSSSSVVGAVVGVLVVLLLVSVIGFLVWRKKWRGTGVMVQFSNRFDGAIQQDLEDRNKGLPDERERRNQIYESRPHRDSTKEGSTNLDSDSPVERVPEDLAGRICYELEPLVDSL